MPVISVDPRELSRLSDIHESELLRILPRLGVDVSVADQGKWELEVFPDRCDMLSVEGVSRAVKGLGGRERGCPEYTVKPTDIVTEVELSVQDVRPFIVTALVRNVELDDRLLRSLMDIQEKLHLTLGRNRRKVAIGVHDFHPVKPPFIYKAVKPDEISFVPLQKSTEMNLGDILEKHEKGRDYAHIIEGKDKYPVILDSNHEVLSFPPIINGILTRVTPETDTLFIDMTGTDEKALVNSLNILCTMLASRGADIHSTTVSYGGRKKVFPDLTPGQLRLDLDEAGTLLGIPLDTDKAVDALERMRYTVRDISGGQANLLYPAYRHDILHPWDAVEDLAIGLDYENFPGMMPRTVTVGNGTRKKETENTVAELLVGYGFNEVMNFPLNNPDRLYSGMCLEHGDEHALLDNPVSEEHSCLRTWLIPSLLLNLKNNRNRPLPQRFFEIGDIVVNGVQYPKLAAVDCHTDAGFTGTKSMIEGMMRALGIDHHIVPKKHHSFITGRCASLVTAESELGFFGEIHPQVLSNFELEYPCSAMELDLRKLG